MANVINRTTKQFLASINTPDYPESSWIINPDLSQLSAVPEKYWKIVGNSVVEMDQSERAVVDAAEAAIVNIPIAGTQRALFSDSRVGNDQYINIGSLSNGTIGFLLPTRGVVKHISAQWSNETDDFNINLRKNGVEANLHAISVVGDTKQDITSNVNILLSAGDSIQIYISNVGSRINDLIVVVWFDLLGN